MRIATYNIHASRGRDGAVSVERIAAVLEACEADVIALQEVEGRRSRTLVDQAEQLASLTGMELAEGPLVHDAVGGYGNAILSRWPFVDIERRVFAALGYEMRGLLDVEIAAPVTGRWRVLATHLDLSGRARRRQLREIASLLDDPADAGLPTVLMGDLNVWWPWPASLCGLADIMAFPPSPPSFPSRLPFLSLDRIALRNCELAAPVRRIDDAATRAASDHLPLAATLRPLRRD